ncbi:MAG: M28 family peptidase [Sphingobacteriales bacterium]|nr:MAG: M28 family peptidase [Sphingobacteriales bacterium]
MKERLIILSVLISMTISVFAQNQAPVISNVQAFPDEVNNNVTITFDVADAEGDALELELRVSDNSGATYLVNDIAGVFGDVGYPISPGTGKSITWQYNPAELNSGIYLIKLIADDRQPVDIQNIVNQVNIFNLLTDLTDIEGVRHYTAGLANIEAVKTLMETRFTDAGLQTSRQDFTIGAISGQNIIGRKQGQGDETKTVIIDAHFDTVSNSPGADDNGSGVVGVLEAMRVLSFYEFRNNIKFIGFDQEEGGLIGSSYYVNNGGVEPFEYIKGVLNYEMIGYYSEVPNSQSVPTGFNILFADAYAQLAANEFKGDFLINVANTLSNPLRIAFDSCAALYVPELKVISLAVPGTGSIAPDLRRSDHAKFWDGGHRALMLTDGANFRNLNYHTPNDVVSTLDFDFMANNVKATVATAAHLAEVRHCTTAVTAVSLTTGIDDGIKNTKLNFAIQPNPAANSTSIVLPFQPFSEKIELKIIDISGKTVLTQAFAQASSSTTYLLRTDSIPNGVYIVVLKAGEHHAVQRLVINR